MSRICDFCKTDQNKYHGKVILSKDALTYKWKCKRCLEGETKKKEQYPAEVVR